MSATTWVRSPIDHADQHLLTRRGTKSVLVLVPHIVAGTRLLDLMPLLEADHRIQVVFSDPHDDDNWEATRDFLHAHGAAVLPWAQARRSRLDLVLAGSVAGLDQLAAPPCSSRTAADSASTATEARPAPPSLSHPSCAPTSALIS